MITIKQKNLIEQGTSLHIIVTTGNCNLRCVYCQVNSEAYKKHSAMTKPTAKKTVDFIFQTPSHHITIEFQGGEPTLNFPIIEYIVKYANKKNETYKKELEFLLVTNFNNMDDNKFDFLTKNNIGICTSLDGFKKLHNKNRPNNSYDNVVLWTSKFNEYYKKINSRNRVYALITITKESLKYPKEIIDEYVKLGFVEINIREMTNLGCAKLNWDKIGYTIDEFLEFWDKCLDYITELNLNGTYFRERMVCVILRKMLGMEEGFMDLRSPCGAVIGQMAYNYNGDIYSCDEARMLGNDYFKMGTVDDNYTDIINSPKTDKIIKASLNNKYYPCKVCDYKEFCGLCPVCTFDEQKDLVGDIAKTPRCKIYRHLFEYVIKKYINTKNNNVYNGWIYNN